MYDPIHQQEATILYRQHAIEEAELNFQDSLDSYMDEVQTKIATAIIENRFEDITGICNLAGIPQSLEEWALDEYEDEKMSRVEYLCFTSRTMLHFYASHWAENFILDNKASISDSLRINH